MNPTNRSTKADIEKWLKPILKKQNLENYTIEVSGSSEKGDGYLGDITFVKVSGKAENNEDKTYNFVIKSGKKSNQLREMMPVRNAFENEEEKGIKEPFDNVPKCYGTLVLEDMEVLILENMKEADYCLWDRTQPMNKEHIRTVIKAYGKLHAISFALRDQKPKIFKKLSSNLQDILKMFTEAIETPKESTVFQDIINLARKKKDFEVLDKVLKLNEETNRMNDLTDPNDAFAVILHGDCWNNNFMFKYENKQKTKLSEVCLLDFQISRLASPVYDLSYFLFTCISEEDLENFDQIVDVYYESFSDFLRQLGSDPDKLFPFEELMNQWRRFSTFGLMLMPSIIRICLSDKDEVTDLTETAESGREITEAFTYTVKNIKEYERRTLPIIKLAIDKKFI